MLGTATASTTGVWPRAVALLLRHALEEALCRYWQGRKPQLARCPPHTQALCLESYADPATARRWSATRAGLSRACHYHGYELAPTQGELCAWRDDVERVIGALRSGRGDELPPHSAAVWGGAAVNGRQVPHVLGRHRRGHHSCHRKRALATAWAPSSVCATTKETVSPPKGVEVE